MASAGAGPAASGPSVVGALWRGVDILRPIALLYAAYSVSIRHEEIERPWLAWTILGALGAWTLAMVFYRPRTMPVIGFELGLACAAVLATRLVDSPEVIAGGANTVPGIWPAATVVAWAVHRGWRGGIFAALVVGLADLVEVADPTKTTIYNIVLLFLLGGCIGYCADLARAGHAALTEALRVQAQVRERDRLARSVHDGVLQTLSYIHRRGVDMGGEARELGAMAADQERLLRALVNGVSSPVLDAVVEGEVDLRLVLGRYAEGAVQVIPPADPVMLERRVADELAAAVHAALDNVRKHAGDDACAWVLIEDDGADVIVTIRDNGIGVPANRLREAAASGRMGVASSIKGRLADLGGSATYDTRSGAGTCLELRAPKKGHQP